jgi:branched-chain amino acid transport system substrate-binding protein
MLPSRLSRSWGVHVMRPSRGGLPRLAIAGVALLTVMTACGGTAVAPPPTSVVVGFLADGDGQGADRSADAVRGVRLALDVVNRSFPDLSLPLAAGTGLPRLGGATLELVTANTDNSPTEAVTRVNALVSDEHAVAVVLADSADVAAAVGSEAQRLAVPLLDAASTADYLTELGLDWYFRTGPTDRVFAETVFGLLQGRLGEARGSRVGILAEPGAVGAAGAVRLREMADRAGYAVVRQVELARTTADRRDQARLLSASACDVVLAVAGAGESVQGIAEITSEMSGRAPVIGVGPAFVALRQRDIGSRAEIRSGPAVLRTASWSPEFSRRSPVARPVAELYDRLFGTPMTPDAALAFTATLVLAAAIDGAGSTQPAAIRAALRKLSTPATQMIMPWSGIRFDANGQNQLAAAVVEGLDSNGFRVTYPPELMVGRLIWS